MAAAKHEANSLQLQLSRSEEDAKYKIEAVELEVQYFTVGIVTALVSCEVCRDLPEYGNR